MIEIGIGVIAIIAAAACALGLTDGWLPIPVGSFTLIVTGVLGAALLLRGLYRLRRKSGKGDQRGLRSAGLTGVIAGSAIALTLAMPMLVAPLNLISIAGFPLGYYLAAQGALAVLVVLMFVYAMRHDRIDETDGG